MIGYVNPQLHAEIVERLTKERDDLNRQLSEMRSDLYFWKRAAEQAIASWNQLEDSIEATHEVLDAIKSNVEAAQHLLNNDAPPAPETPKLHVVPDASLETK